MKLSINALRLAVRGCFFLLAVMSFPALCQQDVGSSKLMLTQQRIVENDISDLVLDVIRKNSKPEGQGVISKPKVSYDTETAIVQIDLGRAAVPKRYTASLDEQLALIERNVVETVGPKLEISQVKFLFGGVDIYYFFPEERAAGEGASS
jgi:hypothetical protein